MVEAFRNAHPAVEIMLHEHNMADLYKMLDGGKLDVVFGVVDAEKNAWTKTFLYREPLFFVPCGAVPSGTGETIRFDQIARETFVMVPNGCGLARATRSLFRSHRRKLSEYGGKALSYQVLEEWAGLGLGAALLPRSKIRASGGAVLRLTDTTGKDISLVFEAIWLNNASTLPHVQAFKDFLWGRPGSENAEESG